MAASNLTLARLREALHYDPATGTFTWLKPTGRRARAGDVAGLGVPGIPGQYGRVTIDGMTYHAHRLAWFYVRGVWPDGEVDHKNGRRWENWFENLRDATRVTNAENFKSAKSNNACGVLGVHQEDRPGRPSRFIAGITSKGKRKYLGTFDTPEQAHAVYLEAKRREHAGCLI